MGGVIDIDLQQVITIIIIIMIIIIGVRSVNIKTVEFECDGLSIGWLQYPSLKIDGIKISIESSYWKLQNENIMKQKINIANISYLVKAVWIIVWIVWGMNVTL